MARERGSDLSRARCGLEPRPRLVLDLDDVTDCDLQSNLPDWSTNSAALSVHATAYWVSMGVASCQISGTGSDGSVSGSSGGGSPMAGPTNVTLSRSIGGVPVVESLAVARFDSDNQTTYEAFYWPSIPADVVSTAIAFSAKLASASGLAAYKAKLPADAQGQGRVVINHTSAGSPSPFQAAATYDVVQTTPEGDGGNLSFDQNSNPVTTVW